MDELIYYNAKGNPQDKKHLTAFSYLASLHTSKTYHQYRISPSSPNASVNLSLGYGSHLLVSLPEKPMLHVYLYGKESPEQFIPLPEIMTSLTTYSVDGKPSLLLGGSGSGRLYVWCINSGLLLCVKQAHYQPLTHIATTSGFIATGSKDSRVVIHTINSLFMNNGDENNNDKPFAVITDHTLSISSLAFTDGLNNDLKLISSSLDSTVRIYSITLTNTANLITTLVSNHPITSLTHDPAFRTLYLGLSNGHIRCVPLYKANPKTKVLEAVGGLGRIVTLKPDLEYMDTIVCHSEHHKSETVAVTQLKASFDGTLLVSGDDKGCVFVIDIKTQQIRKKLKELVGEISNIELWTINPEDLRFENKGVDKNLLRTIPVLKRSIAEEKDLLNHTLTMQLKGNSKNSPFHLQKFLNDVQEEEVAFANFSGVDSRIATNNNNGYSINIDKNVINNLKQEISEKEAAYNSLKIKYDELLAEYTNSVNK
ncbi:hypothetical protein CANINC_002387 [Pichia inconspicua]|uniref:Pre-rRNA-processing protein IPI3 n=1 Tax=Pichia inconspicua TaxID=52247 RepID=A0A4T0X315_9ASCO|nr:hypothetical protein CANINC_002387 [[Candida] inconspicua]